jgi:hypothetical protein
LVETWARSGRNSREIWVFYLYIFLFLGYELDLVEGFVMGLGLWVGFRWVDVGRGGVCGLWWCWDLGTCGFAVVFVGYGGARIWGPVPSNDPTKSTSEAELGQIMQVVRRSRKALQASSILFCFSSTTFWASL